MLWQYLSLIYPTCPIQDSCNTIYRLTYTSIHILFISLLYFTWNANLMVSSVFSGEETRDSPMTYSLKSIVPDPFWEKKTWCLKNKIFMWGHSVIESNLTSWLLPVLTLFFSYSPDSVDFQYWHSFFPIHQTL